MLRFLQTFYQRRAARSMFARWAAAYEDDVKRHKYSAADKVADTAIEYLKDAQSPVDIADIGIGTGLVSARLRDAVSCRIRGMDFSDDMLALCAQTGVADQLYKIDAGRDDWPLPAASQDAIVSAGLLEYFTAGMLQHFLQQSGQALRQGGYLFYTYIPSNTDKDETSLWRGKSGTFLSCSHTPDGMERRLTHQGLTLVRHTPPFSGSVYHDGSNYSYRLIVARKS